MRRNMHDFVTGKCEALADKNEFVKKWLQSDGDPCSLCGFDRSRCAMFRRVNATTEDSEKK